MKPVQKILPILVVAIFASLSLLLMASGASAYRSAVDKASAAADRRTAARYIATRIHTAPSPSAVSVEPFEDCEALAIQDAGNFYTMIYAYDGWLMEACVVKGGLAGPADGTRLLRIRNLGFALDEDGIFSASGTMPDGSAFHVESVLDDGRWSL